MFRLQIEARLSWRVRIVMIASVALFLATVIQAQSSRPNGMPSPLSDLKWDLSGMHPLYKREFYDNGK